MPRDFLKNKFQSLTQFIASRVDFNALERYYSKQRKIFPAVLLLLALSLSLFTLITILAEEPAVKEEALLLELVAASGAATETVNLTGWVRVDATGSRVENIELLAQEAAGRLNLPEAGRQVERWRNSYACGVNLKGQLHDGTAYSVLGQALDIPEGQKASHLMLSVSGTGEIRAGRFEKNIHQVLEHYGGKGQVALTCSGKINQALDVAGLTVQAEKMMELAGAVVQERTTGDHLVSLTGLSPRFSRDLQYAGKEVNLNVALRSDPAENVTYVYAASPLIFTEY
jgi:hypothetical protein